MGDQTAEIGSTITATISSTSGEFPVATGAGETLFVSGDMAVGDRLPVRILKESNGVLVGICEGAEIKLRIDEITADGEARAYPDYGPVVVDSAVTEQQWYRCRVLSVQDEYVTARSFRKIPRRSDIESGPLPDEPTQTLNHLVNNKHNDS